MPTVTVTDPRSTLTAANLYLTRGWSPIPLAAGKKWPPPNGVTGWNGRYTTRADLARREWDWTGNIALRLPPDVVGVDIDVYHGGGQGLAELEERFGPLPDTAYSTSRDDGSGIALYRVPNGTALNTDPAVGIDMVQAHHRYVVCAPSMHPEGRPYVWLDAQSGDELDGPPEPDELPELPWAWIEGLAVAKQAGANAATPDAARAFIAAHSVERHAADRLKGLTSRLAAVRPGGRHDALISTMCWAMREAAAGCYPAEEAIATINAWWIGAVEASRRESGEFGAAVLWAVAQAATDPERITEIRNETAAGPFAGLVDTPQTPTAPPAVRVDPGTGEVLDGTSAPTRNLPDEFWNHRPSLSHIRQAAHARARSADAVLACTLARLCALIPPSVKLPPIVGSAASLNLLVATVGTSGAGKTTGNAVARELVPIDRRDVVADMPMGSGEGLVELFFEMVKEEQPDGKTKPVKRQTKRGLFMYLDEGQALGAMGNRQGATLLPTLRSAWSGDTIGQSNASQETHRVLPQHSYRMAVAVGFQAEYANDLLADAAGGTPQRFVFAAANDPSIPDQAPEWPGPLHLEHPSFYAGEQLVDIDPDIADEVRARNLAAARGQAIVSPLDSHRDLVRLKIAALLAYLDGGRLDVSIDDWELAADVIDASTAVRTWVADIARSNAQADEMRRHRQAARREEVVAQTIEDRALRAASRAVARRVWRDNDGPVSRREMGRAIASRDLKIVTADEAIGEAERLRWITRDDTGIVGAGWVPGEAKPA